jgi:hypothetical protein
MARQLLYEQWWKKGSSAFCNPHHEMNFPPSTDTPLYPSVDPAYPEILEADYCKVVIGGGPNGENYLDCDLSGGGDHVVAGLIIRRALYCEREMEALIWCNFSTAAWNSGFAFSLPFWFSRATLGGSFDNFDFGIFEDNPNELTFSFESWNGDYQESSTRLARSYVENRWFEFRLRVSLGGTDAEYDDTTWDAQASVTIDIRRDDQTSWTRLITMSGLECHVDNLKIECVFLGFYGLIPSTGLRIYKGFGDDDAQNAPLGQCCSTAGAAGGGTVNPDGTVTPVGPRQGTAGGIAPSYTPCPGGGELPAATDPTDPQALDGVEDPIVHLLLEAPAGDQRWGASDINAGTTSLPIAAKVLRYSDIPSEVLAGRDGVIPSPSFTVRVEDTDRTIRGWSQHATNRIFLGQFGQVLAEAYGQRQLDTEARNLAAGYVSDWKWLDELVAEFTFADALGWKRGAMRRRVPIHTVTKEIFGPGVPDDSLGRPIPWIYGEMSDDYEWSLDSARLPVGITPCIPLGYAETIPFVNNLVSLGTDWQAFLFGKVCKTFTAAYMWNGSQDTAVRARIPIDYPVIVDWMFPTMPTWSSYWSGSGHVRVQAQDGTLYDLTMGFLRGPRGYEAGTTQRFPLTCNLWGIEDVGDCTGDVITDGPTALAHFIAYGIFANHTSGPWGAIPTLPNGAPVINRASVLATKAIFDLRIAGGYPAAFAIGATGRDRRTGEEEATAKARGLDIRLGRDHFGAIKFDTVNDLASTSGLTAFTDADIKEGSFTCAPRPDRQQTITRFAYGPEPGTGRTTGLEQELRDEAAIADWGEEGGDEVFLNEAVRRQNVATDVARRGLLRDSDMPHDGSFITNLRGTSLTVGQVITITTEWAHWPDDEAHRVKVTGITPLTNEDELLTRIEFEDVHRLISTPSTALVGMVGPAWGQPIGSSVGLTSQPIGSSAAGTARRLA